MRPLYRPILRRRRREFSAQLRRWRRYEFTRIAWRDLAGWADVPETLRELSECADAAISVALAQARAGLVARFGEPRPRAGKRSRS